MLKIPAIRFARMGGSSIAAPAAAGWVTDFLNAAYYARPESERDVADLRLAHGILTTLWASKPKTRLGARDVFAMNRAFGRTRLHDHGQLDHEALLVGARIVVGRWFPDAWADDARRAHGIAFASDAERRRFSPTRRLRHSALGPIAPPSHQPSELTWETYDPVKLSDPDAALALLANPERWPDIGSSIGRFTALRDTGLLRQTFEIEVATEPSPRMPVFVRSYATCTAFHRSDATTGGETALHQAVAELGELYRAGAAAGAPPMLPPDATPLALIVLTTHEGHFLGRALSHLLAWRDADGAWIRDVGAWDPLPLHLATPYATAGKAAQHEFWGPTPPERSMLAQLAAVSGG